MHNTPTLGLVRALLVLVVAWLANSGQIVAHTPHDHVQSVQLSPSFATDRQIFAIVRKNLFRSVDAGESWHRLAPGIGGADGVDVLALSPSFAADGTMFVASSASGELSRSEDRGANWTPVHTPVDPDGVAFVRFSPAFQVNRVALAVGGSGSLLRTADGGETWRVVSLNTDHIADIGNAKDTVVAATVSGAILLSLDDGAVWHESPSDLEGLGVTCLEVPESTSVEGPFYLGTAEDGVYAVVRDGAVYKARRIGLSGQHITSLASARDGDGRLVLLATTWREALFRSDDEGATWRHGSTNLTTHHQADEFGAHHFKGIAVAKNFADQPTIFLGGYDGLFKTDDGGTTWRELETLWPGLIVGFDLTTDWDGNLLIGVANYTSGAYFHNSRDSSWRVANVGLSSTRVGAITFSPNFAADRTVFVSQWGGVFWSTDGGARWHGAHVWSGTLRSVVRRLAQALGYTNWSRIFPSAIAVSPSFATDHTLFVGIRASSFQRSGIHRSTDAGKTFHRLWNSNGQAVLAIALSPNLGDDGTAVAVLAEGIYMTADRGESWSLIRACDGACSPALAISPEFQHDRSIFAADQSGLVRTRDGGATWQSLSSLVCCRAAIDSMALSPAFAVDHEIIVSVTGVGLFQSRDAGNSFQPIAQSLSEGRPPLWRMANIPDTTPTIKYSPHYAEDRTIVASTTETLIVSVDGGETWNSIVGRPVRYEDNQDGVAYDGSWRRVRGHQYSALTVLASDETGTEVMIRFVGSGFRVVTTRGPDQGVFELSLDGEVINEVDGYAPINEYGVFAVGRHDLAPGPHQLDLRVTGSRNARSLGTRVEFDAIDVFRD